MASDSHTDAINQQFDATDESELAEITLGQWGAVEIGNWGANPLWFLVGVGSDPGDITPGENGTRRVSPGTSVTWPVNAGGADTSIFVRLIGTENDEWSVYGMPIVAARSGGGGGGGGVSGDAATLNGEDGTYYLDRGNHQGTQTAATISDFNTAVDARVNAGIGAVKGQANGLASLGADGKVPLPQLPNLSIPLEVFVVDTEQEQLELEFEGVAIAVRTDEGKTYIYNGGTAGDMTDWTELVNADAVTSVNSKTGNVVLDNTDVGAAAASHNHGIADINDFQDEVESIIQAAVGVLIPTIPDEGIVVREYDEADGWPERGSVPEGWHVLWVNKVDDTLPTSGGSGAVVGVDYTAVTLPSSE